MTIRERLVAAFPEQELTLATGFDKAIMGVDNDSGRVIYSIKKIMKILEKDMSREDAKEYFSYNVAGSFVGEMTPIYCDDEF